jgi:hypothetical protein
MKVGGRLVVVHDQALAFMRRQSDLKPTGHNPVPLPAIGSAQRVVSGGFEGLTCRVVGHAGSACLVEFCGGDLSRVKIPPFLLVPDQA